MNSGPWFDSVDVSFFFYKLDQISKSLTYDKIMLPLKIQRRVEYYNNASLRAVQPYSYTCSSKSMSPTISELQPDFLSINGSRWGADSKLC